MAQSAQLYFQAAHDLGRQAFALAEDLNTQAIAGAKALAGAKSLKEAAEVQVRFARSALERAASEAPRLQQAALQVAERAADPLTGSSRQAPASRRAGRGR